MRQILFLILLLANTALAFDTTYVPNQHAAIVTIQCDDAVDTTYVGVALEHGITIDFAPYPYGGVIDIDSNFVKGEAYKEHAIRFAKNAGMTFSLHDQPQAPTIAGTYGRDSLITRWNNEKTWLRGVLGGGGPFGFVWVGHVNNPETRAMAREYGMKFTRGDLLNSPDLYYPQHGRQTGTGAFGYSTLSMQHKALIPSCSIFRLTGMVVDSLRKGSVARDTTHLWRGTKAYLNTLAGNNAHAVWNIHPCFTGVHTETEADTIAAVWVRIPNTYAGAADSIMFSRRRGSTSRNDASSYQLDYILKAAQWWSDSTAAANSGKTLLCIANLQELMDSPLTNMRTDNSDDPDDVADTFTGGANVRWVSRDGLFAKDPALNRELVRYVDGSGTVKAGNGTAQYPLPRSAWDNMFNCKVEFVNVDADTFNIINPESTFGGEVDIDWGGLVVTRTTDTGICFNPKATGESYYHKGITWRNLTVDLDAGSTGQAFVFGSSASAVHDSIVCQDFTLENVTVRNGKLVIATTNVKGLTVDACTLTPGAGAFTDVAGAIVYANGANCRNTLIRNSVLDLSDCGTGSYVLDFATTNPMLDSLRFLNNVVILGNVNDTDDTHYLIRTNTDSTTTGAKKLRIAGLYLANSRVGAAAANVWSKNQTSTVHTLAQLTTYLAPGGMGVSKAYIATGWAFAYDHLTDVSDTTRFGGYTGAGSSQTGNWATIGQSVYGYSPTISYNPAAYTGASAAAQMNVYEMAALYTTGVLAPCDSMDIATWAAVQPPIMPPEVAQFQITLGQYNAMPLDTRQKMKLRVGPASQTNIYGLADMFVSEEVAACNPLDSSTWVHLPKPVTPAEEAQFQILLDQYDAMPEATRDLMKLSTVY